MDTTKRLLTKSITWQLAGFVTMTLIGFLFTNSFAAGSGIALVGSIVGFLSYFVHEMLWSKIQWGRGNVERLHINKNNSDGCFAAGSCLLILLLIQIKHQGEIKALLILPVGIQPFKSLLATIGVFANSLGAVSGSAPAPVSFHGTTNTLDASAIGGGVAGRAGCLRDIIRWLASATITNFEITFSADAGIGAWVAHHGCATSHSNGWANASAGGI